MCARVITLTNATSFRNTVESKLQYLVQNHRDMILRCPLVQREICAAVKRKSVELHETYRVRFDKIEEGHVRKRGRVVRKLAVAKAQVTKLVGATRKKDASQRGLLTKLRSQLDGANKMNAKLLEVNTTLLAEKEDLVQQLAKSSADHGKERVKLTGEIILNKTKLREERKRHGEVIHRIRLSARQNRSKLVADSKSLQKRVNNLTNLSDSLQSQFNNLFTAYSKQVIGPFAQEKRMLQRIISRMATQEQAWIDKVASQREVYKTLMGRIKLLKKKRVLNDRISQLKEKLSRERDRGLMVDLRAQIDRKNTMVTYLENHNEELREQLKQTKDSTGPVWAEQMFGENKKRVRYANEYVAAAVDMMAKANIDGSCMPGLMSKTFKLWLDNPDLVPNFASARQFCRWREGVSYLCLIHIGYLVTKHAKDATVIQDGTPDDGYHIRQPENFRITSLHSSYYRYPVNDGTL